MGDYLLDRSPSRRRRNLEGLDIGHVIDLLSVNNLLGGYQIELLHKARSWRNRVLHRGEKVRKEEAAIVLKLLFQLSSRRWAMQLPTRILAGLDRGVAWPVGDNIAG